MKRRVAVRAVQLFLAACVLWGSAPNADAQFEKVVTLKEALKRVLQTRGAVSLSKRQYNLTEAQRSELVQLYRVHARERYLMYTGLDGEKRPVGTALIIDVQGKEGPLQLVIAVEPETGAVYDLGFTLFGEERGKPAARPSYLKQFLGADAAKPFVLGEDIEAVTGATWTSESVRDGVKLAVSLYDYLVLGRSEEGTP